VDILAIFLLIVVLVLFYIIFNLNRKLNKYEQMVDNYDNLLIGVREYLKISLDRLYVLDSNHIFEGDDEVGWFFKSLKDLYVSLNNNIAELVNEEKTEE
jgi:hypothetical protein